MLLAYTKPALVVKRRFMKIMLDIDEKYRPAAVAGFFILLVVTGIVVLLAKDAYRRAHPRPSVKPSTAAELSTFGENVSGCLVGLFWLFVLATLAMAAWKFVKWVWS